MTDNSVIQSRLADMDRLRYFKRKAHAMRKVTAGDWSMFGDSAAANNPDAKAPLKPDGLYDILVMDVNEGKSNLIFQAVRTLTMQCTVQFPDITFPDIETEESDVNQLYLNARLGPKPRGCSAMDEMRLALLDYMISGIGWVWCGVRNGAPVVQCVDTLDMYWDCDAKLLTGIRWQAAAFHRPCSEWVKEFGAAYGDNDPDDPDEIETVLFYFDCDGKDGTYAAFKFDGQGLGDPIEVTPNPHFMTVDGERAPFLPIEPMYFMALPSVKFPMSLVEAMLAPAISYRQSEDYINQVTKMGKPFYDIEEGQLSEDERKNLEEGNYGAIVMRKIGSPAISIKPGMEIPGAVMNWMTINKQEIVANSGANPYASGNKVEGVTYAAEVNAIQNSAGLMAATISRDHASHWARVSTKTLANGKNYDFQSLRLNRQGVNLQFGPQDPIAAYLRPDAPPSVTEDSMRFEPKEAKIARAGALASFFANPLIMQQFPSGLKESVELLLRANEVKDVAAFMAPPQAPPPGTAPGAAPGMPPGAMPQILQQQGASPQPSAL